MAPLWSQQVTHVCKLSKFLSHRNNTLLPPFFFFTALQSPTCPYPPVFSVQLIFYLDECIFAALLITVSVWICANHALWSMAMCIPCGRKQVQQLLNIFFPHILIEKSSSTPMWHCLADDGTHCGWSNGCSIPYVPLTTLPWYPTKTTR